VNRAEETINAQKGRLRRQADKLASRIESEQQVLEAAQQMPRSDSARSSVAHAQQRLETLRAELFTVFDQLTRHLENRNQVLEKENAALRQNNEKLSYRLKCSRNELQRALGVAGNSGDNLEKSETEPTKDEKSAAGPAANKQKRRGAPKGHKGNTRKVPDRVDYEKVIPPEEQCDCGCRHIIPRPEYDEKYIEDIPPVIRQITRRIYMRGQCSSCGKVLRHSEAANGPPVEIGPNLAVQLTLMNQAGMTFGKLSSFSTRALGIPLTPSGVLGIVNRVCDSLTGVYNKLGDALRHQQVLNGDETGWKVLGQNCYIWCFCNHRIAYFHPDYRRSSEVIEEILGKDFKGVVMCDFYAAYNCIDKTQRCLVHLLRDIKKEREVLSSKLLKRFDEAIRSFIDEGLKVQAMPDGNPKEKAIEKLEKQLDKIIRMPVTKGRGETLIKRMQKYRDDLIRFVTHPGLEFHNNRAERQLRPLVISRKISFGSNTDSGAIRHCILNTIIETCKIQNLDPNNFLSRAYESCGLNVPELTANSPPTT